MATKTHHIDMLNGSLWDKILKFAAIQMLSALVQQLYSAADIVVVGRFAGPQALAGVGTCSTLTNLFLHFITGLSAGATIVLAQAIGSKERKKIEKAAHTSIAVALCGGLIIAVVCIMFAKPLLNFINVPSDVMSEASAYLRIMALGFPASLIYNFGTANLNAKGDNKRALYIVTTSGIINILFNLFFVCVLHMKASGVATATVISQIYTAVMILYMLCHEKDETRIFLNKIRIYKEPFLKILRFGLPSGIQSSIFSISNMLVQSSTNSFGSAAIAGSAATSSITNFYNIMGNSLYHSSIVFTSQNFGAKNFERIKKITFICIGYLTVIWAIQSLITFFLGEILLGFYAPNQPEVIEMGMRKFSILGYSFGLAGIMNIMSGTLRGMGASFINMITAVTGVCGIRILWVMTAFQAIGTFESLYICFPLSWLGTSVMHAIMVYFVFNKEKRKHLNIKNAV